MPGDLDDRPKISERIEICEPEVREDSGKPAGALTKTTRRRLPRQVWIGAALLLCAALVRVPMAGWARFCGDEASAYAVAMEMVRGDAAPLLGPPISGGHARTPGPLYYWLAAVPQLFSDMPDAGNLFHELLGVIAVLAFWQAMRRPFGEAGAAFAGLMMAFMPWCAFFAERTASSMGTFMAMTTLAILAAVRLQDNARSAWVIVLLPTSAALVQLHLAAPVVWLGLLPLVLPSIRRWKRSFVLIGVGLTVALFIPFAIHEVRSHFDATRTFMHETFGPKRLWGQNNSFVWLPVYVIRFLTLDVSFEELMGYWEPLDELRALASLWHGTTLRPFHVLRFVALIGSLVLLSAAFAAAIRSAVRRAHERGARHALGPFGLAAIVTIAGNVLLLAVTHKQIYAAYVAPTIPFVLVVYAALGRELAASSRRLRFAGLTLTLVFVAGALEATWSVSWGIDARLGVTTHRTVLSRVYRDLEGRPPGTPVRLEQFLVGARASTYGYEILARYGFRRPLAFTWSNSGLVYRLQDSFAAPPPRTLAPPQRIGPVTLYRLN